MEPTRAEPTCIRYRFYQDVENRDAFSLLEHWQDRASVDGHFRSKHVSAFLVVLGDLIARPPEAYFDDVASTRGWEAVEAARA